MAGAPANDRNRVSRTRVLHQHPVLLVLTFAALVTFSHYQVPISTRRMLATMSITGAADHLAFAVVGSDVNHCEGEGASPRRCFEPSRCSFRVVLRLGCKVTRMFHSSPSAAAVAFCRPSAPAWWFEADAVAFEGVTSRGPDGGVVVSSCQFPIWHLAKALLDKGWMA